MHTVWEGLLLLPLLHLADALCHGAVGKQHELLHELIGVFGILKVHTYGFAVFVYLKSHLLAVEVDGTILEALVSEPVSYAVERDEQVGILSLAMVGRHRSGWYSGWIYRLQAISEGIELGVGDDFLGWYRLSGQSLAGADEFTLSRLTVLFKQILHLLVCVSPVALYDSVLDARIEHFRLIIHLKDGRESQFLLVGTEGAEHVA